MTIDNDPPGDTTSLTAPAPSCGSGTPADGTVDAHRLAELARDLHDTTQDLHDALEVLFAQVAELHPVVGEHVSVTVRRRRNQHESLGTSSPLAAKADQLQYDLNEGPCVDAASPEGEEWYRSGDLRSDHRWPRWGPAAADLGVHSVLAVQLLRSGERFGAINLYAEEHSQFTDPKELDRFLLWAVHAATALSAAWTEAGLQTAISARHKIGIAQGILVNALDLDAESAFQYLARVASHRQCKLHDVADDIVRTRQIPQL